MACRCSRTLIGLDWPVAGDLTVTEVHTPLLEGYAGSSTRPATRSTISEDLDDLDDPPRGVPRLVQRASSPTAGSTRASPTTYAATRPASSVAGRRLGAEPGDADAAAAFALNDWRPPGRIDDDATEAREDFGYDAVVDRHARARRRDRRRRDAGGASRPPTRRTIAYLGDGRAGDGRRRRTTGSGSSTSSRRSAESRTADEPVPALGRRPTSATAGLDARDRRAGRRTATLEAGGELGARRASSASRWVAGAFDDAPRPDRGGDGGPRPARRRSRRGRARRPDRAAGRSRRRTKTPADDLDEVEPSSRSAARRASRALVAARAAVAAERDAAGRRSA